MPRKTAQPEIEEMIDEELEDEEVQMSPDFEASLTVAIPEKVEDHSAPRVSVFLPKLIDDDSGIKVDQYEHVTIANELGEKVYYVLRGEPVEVPIPVFIALKEKYPKI